jgi:hypothetical protein
MVSKPRASARYEKPNCKKISQPNPFYYQSIADGDIKEIQETVKQLDKNIKQSEPFTYYKFDTSKRPHYSL